MTQSNPSSSDAFNDSLNFVKKLWGGMGVPGTGAPGMQMPGMPNFGMPLPSVSLEDMDKRIAELKTVESWLNVNMTMLHNTIQALEIQRATIATLHSLSSTMVQTMKSASPSEAAEKADKDSPATASATSATSDSAPDISPLISQSAVWWNGVQEQFKQALGAALANSAASYEEARPAGEDPAQSATQSKTKAATKATPGANKTARPKSSS